MEFNLTRFGNLIRRDFITYKKPALYAVASTFGFLLLVYFFNRVSTEGHYVSGSFWGEVYLAFVFILGLTFTSIVFREFKTPGGRLQFLSLPASNLEKLASRWLYSLIVFPLFISVAVWIMSKLTVTNGESMFANFDTSEGGYIFLGFVLAHATMFLYAVWFNNLVAIKGTIVGTIASTIFGLLMVGMFWIIFNEYFEGSFSMGPSINVNMDIAGQQFFMNKVQPVGEFLIKFFIAPFLWVVSYFKMKEKEA